MRHRADKIDMFAAGESEHRARAENEHERDEGRGDNNGAADIARWRSTFTAENGDVFKSAQRAQHHFGKDVQVEHRERGRDDLERVIFF